MTTTIERPSWATTVDDEFVIECAAARGDTLGTIKWANGNSDVPVSSISFRPVLWSYNDGTPAELQLEVVGDGDPLDFGAADEARRFAAELVRIADEWERVTGGAK